MKFNMGCGHNRLAGYVNVDAASACEPDLTWDLEATPWPWGDDCATEVRFIHSLEHMGRDPAVFLNIIQELYRIAAPGCEVIIHVPHPRHDNFLNDPTHVRVITPNLLRLFDRQLNDEWRVKGGSNTPLAHYLSVDFAVVRSDTFLAEPYASRYSSGELTPGDAAHLVETQNNIAHEYRVILAVRKPLDAA